MPPRKLMLPLFFIMALLHGCAREDALAELEAATRTLQENIEAHRTSAVMEQLADDFHAGDDRDRAWAQRTMTLLFMRHRSINVIALSQSSRLDPTYSNKGYTEAQVTLTGAEGLIPDSVRHYSVRLEWWREDGDWRLARLHWD
ncbi:hypothetical protein DN820_07365 [Stutzerimonas nosocomialis]|uniref:Nuclear transport factor 2 family protein n=1 Tax=Stutzerimonas nosocomialis TaxID=1056496 RepID=A0A5R9QGK4_9GAMM|nr:hypothetical protein [Stutzerimonas nosocomialis]TLX64128.1 hypothetical protein DN820_07365 [Stutzerimonas nosocomialis]